MVTIRLARAGAKRRPFYHIVVADSKSPRDGHHVERLGFFNPVASGNDQPLKIDLERFRQWIAKGAQPTERVAHLIRKAEKAQEQAENA